MIELRERRERSIPIVQFTGLAHLLGNAGTTAFFEYGDLGSHDGGMTVTGRC